MDQKQKITEQNSNNKTEQASENTQRHTGNTLEEITQNYKERNKDT